MYTNAEAEIPEPIPECTLCGEEVETCDKCGIEFDDGDDILCYAEKHYCDECAEKIKLNKKSKKWKNKTKQ